MKHVLELKSSMFTDINNFVGSSFSRWRHVQPKNWPKNCNYTLGFNETQNSLKVWHLISFTLGNLKDHAVPWSLWFWLLSKMCQEDVNKFHSPLPDLPDFSHSFFSFRSFFSFWCFGIARKSRSAMSSERRLSRIKTVKQARKVKNLKRVCGGL